jgi:hypothetical protein
MAMWPNDRLWDEMFDAYKKSVINNKYIFEDATATASSFPVIPSYGDRPFLQLGMHFRCGQNANYTDMSQCLAENSHPPLKRRGTNLDVMNVALNILKQYEKGFSRMPLVLISMDDSGASSQVAERLKLRYNISVPSKGCQIDFNTTIECFDVTLVSFMMLAMSDTYATQRSDGLHDNYPPSGFSRLAAIYGFATTHRVKVHGQTNNNPIDWRVQQLNWFC